ncbi:hypothetical protein [Actinomyces bowdenii]|uniref:DUF3618 domain-containing protein n=1 Tax=Actinomyces bowdenii TaxID=131109 RepID=A0A853EH94_9ACTO|nr:hypothetical protein [Actinomyces bowdenii]MBF0696600.1 hypothetical protein [Actinomyces bowdenii]NYS68773.1 hypothetical protein [Actinomyces bowdenii]
MSAAAQSPGGGTGNQAPSPTPETLAAAQDARRRALVSDVDELASRLAPASLARSARQAADSAMSTLRTRGQEVAAQARSQAEALGGQAQDTAQGLLARAGLSREGADRTAEGSPQGDAARAYGLAPSTGAGGQPLGRRLGLLLDDARDGDPVALAIVTAAALGLAGLSGVALIKAMTTLRQSPAGPSRAWQ